MTARRRPGRCTAAACAPALGAAAATAALPAVPAHAEVRQTAPCAVADRAEGAPPVGVPAAQAALDLDTVHRFATGAGQTVAVIDTGVAPHPRLPRLTGGGDLVGAVPAGAEPPEPGLVDCDAHGTLVAGLIAAVPAASDGFVGVAPGARVLAIRQTSAKFSAARTDGDDPAAAPVGGAGTVGTLATAIRMAADQGATVINISEVACARGIGALRSGVLEDAVAYAASRDAVLVAAAGNTGGACAQNPAERDPLHPGTRGWDSAYTDVAPAHLADHVISVASVDPGGAPSDFSLAGPWVTVAAPGRGLTSLANSTGGGLADRVRTESGAGPVDGTSFAAPLVSGIVADVRSRFPELTAPQVIRRIVATARPGPHGWEPTIGYGVVDAVAALTAPAAAVEARAPGDAVPLSGPLIAAPAAAPDDHGARDRALVGVAVLAVLVGAAAAARALLSRASARGPGIATDGGYPDRRAGSRSRSES